MCRNIAKSNLIKVRLTNVQLSNVIAARTLIKDAFVFCHILYICVVVS